MPFQPNPYLPWQLLPALLTFALGLYILTRPLKRRETNSLAAFLFGGTLWSFGNAIQWTSPDPTWQLFWNAFTYLGILVVPTAWLFLVVRFTGLFWTPIRRRLGWFLVVPILTYLAVLTNPLHNLFFASLDFIDSGGFITLDTAWGLLFYAHTAYSYLLMFGGMALLVYDLTRNFKKYGVHAYGLVIGVLTPLVGNAVYLFGSLPPGFPDPTPITFTVTGVAFAWAIVGGRMFETIPLAHSAIIAGLTDGIIVLDAESRVLEVNPAAVEILQLPSQHVAGQDLATLPDPSHPFLEAISPGWEALQEKPARFTVPGTNATYQVTATRLENPFGDLSGRLLQLQDISRIRQVETDLAATQETFGSVLDTLNDSYYEAAPDGTITNANRAFAQALGFSTKEEVIGSHFRRFIGRESIRDIFDRFARLYETGQPVAPFEYVFRKNDGSLNTGEMVVSPIMEGDRVTGARGIIRDVTDRVNAEKEIAAQKELLDGLLQNAPFAIVIKGLDNRILAVNAAFEDLFGYPGAEVAGKYLVDLLATPATKAEMERTAASMQIERRYDTGSRRKKDGQMVDVEIFSGPLFVGGEKHGSLVFYNDITERLKTEAELDRTQAGYFAVLDALPDSYIETDPAGIITYVNPALLAAIGYSKKEELIGRHFRRIVDRSNIRTVAENYRRVYETASPVPPFELVYRTSGGEAFTSEMVVSPIIEGGVVVGTRGIVRDVSERIKSAEVLQAAKEEAEHRAGELAAVNRVAEQVSESLELDEILQTVCRELTQIFPVRNAGIGLIDPTEAFLEIRAFHSVDPQEATAFGLRLPLAGNAASQEVIRTRKALVIEDAGRDARMGEVRELSRSRGTKTIMIVPLLTRGRVIGTIGMPALDDGVRFEEADLELAGTIASQIASAVDNAQLYAQVQSALGAAESDLEIGSQIQSGFFPESLPEIPGWELAAHFHSARQVAGDFYDVFRFAGSRHTAFVIADVCDKGVGAALFMVLFRSLLRAFSNLRIEDGRIAEQLLGIVMRTNNYVAEIHGRSSMFATVFFGILDPDSGVLYYINGGHEAPAVVDPTGAIKTRLAPTGPAVGLFPDLAFEVATHPFDPGDFLVGFTDGTTDARNSRGESFTEERLLARAGAAWTSIFSMLFELKIDLQTHIGEQAQYDDITLISFRRKTAGERDHHAICRPATMERFEEMRDFVEAAAGHYGLDEEAIFAFKLTAEEVLTNIIQYGYRDRLPGLIALAFECAGGRATLKIWDDGFHFPPETAAAPDVGLALEDREIGGLGIFFVRELMDAVSYKIDENLMNLLVVSKTIAA